MAIVVDIHERDSGMAERLRALGCVIEEASLDAGDYLVGGTVGIERKTVTDFVISLTRGRLFSQLVALQASVARPVLIIEGDRRHISQRLHPNSVRGLLITVGVEWGVPILWSADVGETAAFLHLIARRASRLKSQRKHPRPQKSKDKRELQHDILMQIPRVGYHSATALMSRFENLQGLLEASEHDLRQADWIGRKKARAIYQALHESPAP
jgi:Fanconi anemia group M protein